MTKKRFSQKEQRYWQSIWEKTGKKRGETLLEWMQNFLGGGK